MHPIIESTLVEVANILATIMPREDLTALKNLLLVADDDIRLSDRQIVLCQTLLTDLSEVAPQVEGA